MQKLSNHKIYLAQLCYQTQKLDIFQEIDSLMIAASPFFLFVMKRNISSKCCNLVMIDPQQPMVTKYIYEDTDIRKLQSFAGVVVIQNFVKQRLSYLDKHDKIINTDYKQIQSINGCTFLTYNTLNQRNETHYVAAGLPVVDQRANIPNSIKNFRSCVNIFPTFVNTLNQRYYQFLNLGSNTSRLEASILIDFPISFDEILSSLYISKLFSEKLEELHTFSSKLIIRALQKIQPQTSPQRLSINENLEQHAKKRAELDAFVRKKRLMHQLEQTLNQSVRIHTDSQRITNIKKYAEDASLYISDTSGLDQRVINSMMQPLSFSECSPKRSTLVFESETSKNGVFVAPRITAIDIVNQSQISICRTSSTVSPQKQFQQSQNSGAFKLVCVNKVDFQDGSKRNIKEWILRSPSQDKEEISGNRIFKEKQQQLNDESLLRNDSWDHSLSFSSSTSNVSKRKKRRHKSKLVTNDSLIADKQIVIDNQLFTLDDELEHISPMLQPFTDI